MWFSEVDGGHQMHKDCGIIWNWKGKDNFPGTGSSRRAKPPHQRKNIIRHPGGQATVQSWISRAWRKTSLSLLFLFTVPTPRRPRLARGGEEEEQTPLGEKAEKPRAYSLPSTLSPQGLSSIKSGMREHVLWGGVLNWVRIKWWCHHTMTEVRQFLWQSDWRNLFIWEWLVHKIHSKRGKEMGYSASLKRRWGEGIT